MRLHFCLIFVITIVSSQRGANVARADETDDVNAARMHYKKGTRAFELGHYGDAIKEYEAAYQAKDDPALLYNLGQAYRLNDDLPAALRAYKSYLHRIPDASNAEEVRSRILELQKTLDEREHAKSTATVPPIPPAHPETVHAVQNSTPSTTTASPSHAAERTPIYRKWWLWTVVGVVVLGGAATAIAIALTTSRSDGFTSTIPDVGPGPHTASLTVHF